MRRKLLPLGTVIATLLILVSLFAANPFARAAQLLDRFFGAGPEWALVGNVYVNPQTQETSHGEDPLLSFERLSKENNPQALRSRVYLIGNSQTYTVLLAPGEQLMTTPEKAYPDLINDFYRRQNGSLEIYRLAAPNITYMEALWYLVFLAQHPKLQPNAVVLQLNYETFRKTGIRDGLLGMLADPEFAAAVATIASNGRPYSNLFLSALQKRRDQIAKLGKSGTNAGGGSHTGITESGGIGNALETEFRKRLEEIPGFGWRRQMKADFEGVLYRSRVLLLHIRPTTPRSLSTATLVLNDSALDDIASLCHQRGIDLILINAPQNPSALLYKTKADRDLYEDTIRSFAATHNLSLFDFEHIIPASDWGIWIDGPDPIHFGRHGHELMAKVLVESRLLDRVQNHERSSSASLTTFLSTSSQDQ